MDRRQTVSSCDPPRGGGVAEGGTIGIGRRWLACKEEATEEGAHTRVIGRWLELEGSGKHTGGRGEAFDRLCQRQFGRVAMGDGEHGQRGVGSIAVVSGCGSGERERNSPASPGTRDKVAQQPVVTGGRPKAALTAGDRR
jgi:hypothetical protein